MNPKKGQQDNLESTLPNETPTNPKVQALAQYTGISPEDITEGRSENTFEIGNEEYLVLTDEEADVEVSQRIEQDLWAFNPEWLENHMGGVLDADTIKIIQQSKYESASPVFKKLIKDWDHFVDDSVLSDGRGHFLSGYDSQENEEQVNGVYYFIYRTN